MKVTAIYGLFDPRFPDIIMYVGKGLQKHAECHWRRFLSKGTAVNALLRRWFKRLKEDGVEPLWRLLEESDNNWQECEKRWIAHWRQLNLSLCNVADGGNEPSLESSRLGGRLGGPIGGRLGGGRTHKLYPNLAREWSRKGGRNGARRTHELYPNLVSEWARKGGLKAGGKGGCRTHELYPNLAREIGSKGGHIASHNRWHVKRNKSNPLCPLCHPKFFNL